MAYLFVLLGLAGLFAGGTWLVNGASALALRFGLTPFVVGLTVVGFGTSTPELLVSLEAALRGAGGIAIGNVVGSNIANVLLILGVAALIGPFAARLADLRRDLLFMVAAAVLCLPLFASGFVGRIEGAILVAGIGIYLWLCLRAPGPTEAIEVATAPLGRSLGVTFVGLVTLVVGARLLVDGATDIARVLGVSEAVIGLTVVAVGTSLPELATAAVAAWRGERDIALGNVVGSNVFNIFAILGVTALIAPIPVEARFSAVDVPVMIAVSLALVAAIGLAGGVGRWIGAAFLAAYALYVAATGAL